MADASNKSARQIAPQAGNTFTTMQPLAEHRTWPAPGDQGQIKALPICNARSPNMAANGRRLVLAARRDNLGS